MTSMASGTTPSNQITNNPCYYLTDPKLRHQREHGAVRADQLGLHDITVAGFALRGVSAAILEGPVDGDHPPAPKQPGAVQQAHLHESADHGDGNPRHGGDRHPCRLTLGVVRTGDGPA